MNEKTAAEVMLRSWPGFYSAVMRLLPVSRAYRRVKPSMEYGVWPLVLHLWVSVKNPLGEVAVKIETEGFFIDVKQGVHDYSPVIIGFTPSGLGSYTFMQSPVIKYLGEFKAQLERIANS